MDKKTLRSTTIYSITEKEVNSAAMATFNDDEVKVPEIMNKMENALLEQRVQEAKQFFTRGNNSLS